MASVNASGIDTPSSNARIAHKTIGFLSDSSDSRSTKMPRRVAESFAKGGIDKTKNRCDIAWRRAKEKTVIRIHYTYGLMLGHVSSKDTFGGSSH